LRPARDRLLALLMLSFESVVGVEVLELAVVYRCAKKLAPRMTNPPTIAESSSVSPRKKKDRNAPQIGMVVLTIVAVEAWTERRPWISSQLHRPELTRPV
jgi:hypothetical protein